MKVKFKARPWRADTAGKGQLWKNVAGRHFRRTGRLKAWQAYAFATVVTTATLGVRLALDGYFEGRPILIIFTIPIMLSAYIDGMRAGLLATGLSHFSAGFFLLEPVYSFTVISPAERWQQFLVTLVGISICIIMEQLRRRAATAARECQEAVEDRNRFFTLSTDLLCILGFDGFFKELNPAWEKTLGYRREELLGTPFIEFIHPDDRPAARVDTDGAAGPAPLPGFRNRYRCKDGSYRCFQWSVAPVAGDRAMYGVARDITGSEAAEGALAG